MTKDKAKKWLIVIAAVAGWIAFGAKFLAENLDKLNF